MAAPGSRVRANRPTPSEVNNHRREPNAPQAFDEIAVVGVGCRFPGADSLQEFWKVLINGENHVREVDNDRWDFESFYDPDERVSGKSYVNKAGLLNNIDEWDNQLFGVSDTEAKSMDPQQKLVLECCHMAMEDAGITRKHLDGSNTAVFIGAMNDDYRSRQPESLPDATGYVVTGIFRSILSARLSYTYNLKGPCMVIDTACSSSLSAIHLACQSLKLNESNLAVAGGVSVLLDPQPFIALSKAHMLSPTGQCHTFSSDADGYARGEGCGIIILQRLRDAVSQGNNIWGIIRTGNNQDGRMVTPITAPSGEQQTELLERVYRNRREDRNAVQVIEAHGTGTSIGDPTEVTALGSFFWKSDTAMMSKIKIGSVKSNIGHLESAAGVAGLIKVLLMMKHKTVVQSLMYCKDKRNPKIDFQSYNMLVPTANMKWPLGDGQTRTACVNSFGFGGSNSHLLIRQWLPKLACDNNVRDPNGMSYLVVLSSLQDKGLVKNLTSFAQEVEMSSSSLKEISMTSLIRRQHFKYRVAVTTSSKKELKQKCEHAIQRVGNFRARGSFRYVYVFCGVGTTWNGMCTELLRNNIFRETVDFVDKELQRYTGWSIVEKWENKANVLEPLLGHLSIFVCQLGIAAMWMRMKVCPDVVVGQSVGEVAACFVAGLIDLKTAVKLIYFRSMALSVCTKGEMIVVRNVDVKEVQKICRAIGSVYIAVFISSRSCTISGESRGIAQLKQILEDKDGVKVIQLTVPCGYHSPLVKQAGKKLQSKLTGNLKCKHSSNPIQVISTVYGKSIDQNEFLKETYWKNNVIAPVQFHNALLEARGKHENTVFIEIGPSPVLKVHLSDIFGTDAECFSISSVEKGREYSTMLQSLATLYECGSNIDFTALHEDFKSIRPSSIPKYTFNKKVFPVKVEAKGTRVHNTIVHNYVIMNDESDLENFMYIHVSPDKTPYVYEHFVKGKGVIPGALYADVGFEIGKRLLYLPSHKLSVTYDIVGAVTVTDRNAMKLEIKVQEIKIGSIFGYRYGVKFNASIVCQGIVKERDVSHTNGSEINISSLTLFLPQKFASDEIYDALEKNGFGYGKSLRVLQCGAGSPKRCIFEVCVPEEVWNDLENSNVHPSLLDAMVQSVFGCSNVNASDFIVPIGMDSITINPQLRYISKTTKMQILTEMVNHTVTQTMEKMHFNVFLLEGYRTVLVKVENLTFYGDRRNVKCCDDLRYTLKWKQRNDFLMKRKVRSQDFERMTVINASLEFMQSLKEILDQITIDFVTIDSTPEAFTPKLVHKLRSSKHVVVFIDPNAISKQIENSIDTMNAVSNNMKLIQRIILCLKSESDVKGEPELCLLTLGVHGFNYPGEHTTCTSLVGSEVLGFFRNFEMELFYKKISLVDMASCAVSTIKTLLSLMVTLEGNVLDGREFCLYGTQLQTIEVRASTKRFRCPSLRSNIFTPADVSSQITLRSASAQCIHDPFFIARQDEIPALDGLDDDSFIDIEVDVMCVHDRRLFPVTKLDVSQKYGLVTDNQEEGGFPVIAIEMTGTKGHMHARHKAADTEIYVACYPSVVSHFVKVPEECCIKQADIKHYTPGLLSSTLILLELLREIRCGSEIHILHSSLPKQLLVVVSTILKKNNKTCTVLNGTTSQSEFDKSKQTTALVLQHLDPSTAYSTLNRFKHIVSLPLCIPDSVIEELRQTHWIDVSVFDASSAFANKRLRNSMMQMKTLFKDMDIENKIEALPTKQKAFGLPLETISLTIDAAQMARRTQGIHTLKVSKEMLFHKMASYVVVGGLTGIGWIVVEMLAEMGAGVTIIFGRRRPTNSMQKLTSLQEKFNCKIEYKQVDITNENQLRHVIESLEKQFPDRPIRGFFQGAGINISSMLQNTTSAQLDDVLKPKVLGTMNLHIATKHLQLDYFVLLSSISSIFGRLAQTAYGAANSFLDAFANYRRQQGLNAQSINWGGIAVGMTQVGNIASQLEKGGHILLKEDEFRSCFLHSLMTNETNVIYANLDKGILRRVYGNRETAASTRKLVFLWEDEFLTGRGSGEEYAKMFKQDWIHAGDRQERLMMVQKLVMELCSSIFSGSTEDMKASTPLADWGLDSMSSITLVNSIRNYFDVNINVDVMFDPSTTIAGLSSLVEDEINRRLA